MTSPLVEKNGAKKPVSLPCRAEEFPALVPRATLFPEVDRVGVEAVVRRPVLETGLKVPVISFRTEILETRGLGEFGIPEVRTPRKTTEPQSARYSAKLSFVSRPELPTETGLGEDEELFQCAECWSVFDNVNNYHAHVGLHRQPVVQGPAGREGGLLRWGGYTNNRFCLPAAKRNRFSAETACRELVDQILDSI